MAQCSGASGNDLNVRSPKGASFTARWVSPLPHRCMKSSSGSTRGTRRRPSCAVRCPMKMVRAPELESGLREWHSHVLPLNTTPAFLPGHGARRAGRQQPARRRAPQPGTLAIQVVKEPPLIEAPASVEVGVVQSRDRKQNARRTCVDPGVHDPEGSGQRRCGLACTSRIERARIPIAPRMLCLDGPITALRKKRAAKRGRRCLGARHGSGRGR
jgi:hypothetical protein